MNTIIENGSYIALAAPLIGCLVIMLLGMRVSSGVSAWIGVSAVAVAFVASLAVFLEERTGTAGAAYTLQPWTWLTAGAFSVDFSLYIDRLSIMEMLIITGVGLLIHVYSVGYMHGDPQKRRFFAYLNIFIFAMMLLVMAGNLVFLLVGWGLVGMASYLLIGFWHDRPTAVAAAKKAFIINAIGDVSIMLGLFLMYVKMTANPAVESALGYTAILGQYTSTVAADSGTAIAIAALLLGGALAKSAQLPLHAWLPDAMEGPTPVSALIHAATMVTAGVYLIARFGVVFEHAEIIHNLVAVIGVSTLLVAGFIALSQTDIKRVIAYSTMSQIGYMFLAVGVGAYAVAMFHLMVHAFFKALLFMSAGVVIHALDDEQDIRKMGGLRTHMPRTYGLFVIGSLALAGVIPASGFFSKDEILASVFHEGGAFGYTLWILALVGVLMTALYAFRLLFTVFHGDEGEAVKAYVTGEHHGHGEGPATMMVSIYILGFFSATAGLIAIPGLWNLPEAYLEHVSTMSHHEAIAAGPAWLLAVLVSLPVALAGIFIAHLIWNTKSKASLTASVRSLEPASRNALWVDVATDKVVSAPTRALATAVAEPIEARWVPRVQESLTAFMLACGSGISASVNGMLRSYAVGIIAGTLLVLAWFIGVKG